MKKQTSKLIMWGADETMSPNVDVEVVQRVTGGGSGPPPVHVGKVPHANVSPKGSWMHQLSPTAEQR